MELISVIIPLYNKEKIISAAIASVISQLYKDFELIVVNDGSTDDSLSEVNKFSDSRLKVISQANAGVSAARNVGVKAAAGEWIVFLDADDLLTPDCLLKLHELVHKYKTPIGVSAYFAYDYNREEYVFAQHRGSFCTSNPFYHWFMGDYFIRTGNSIFKKELLLRNPFDTAITRYEDVKAFLDIVRGQRVAISGVPVMYHTYTWSALGRYHNFEVDFCSQLKFKGKTFWEKMILCGLLYQSLTFYANIRSELEVLYKDELRLIPLYRILNLPVKFLKFIKRKISLPYWNV